MPSMILHFLSLSLGVGYHFPALAGYVEVLTAVEVAATLTGGFLGLGATLRIRFKTRQAACFVGEERLAHELAIRLVVADRIAIPIPKPKGVRWMRTRNFLIDERHV